VEQGGDAGASLPRFVVGEFESYLACGVLEHGFARVRCAACGDELLVVFSCKDAALPFVHHPPDARHAAHLVDRVIPHVPVR